jgi:hypothetical protein
MHGYLRALDREVSKAKSFAEADRWDREQM